MIPTQNQLSLECNNTQVDYPQDKCIHQLFEEQVELTPDAVAVVFDNQQLTYRELNCRANQLAHYLKSLGLGADVLVGICVERSLEMVVGLLGILKAGGAYVPLDPEYPKERLAFMLSDTQVSVLLTQRRLVNELFEQEPRLVCFDTDGDAIARESQENLVSELAPHHLAYVMYTSGSTGKPKGVQITHANVSHYIPAVSQVLQVQPEDVYLHVASFSFSSSVRQLMVPLYRGATSVIAKREQTKNPISLFELIHKQGVTISDGIHSIWRYGLQALETLDKRHTEALQKSKLRTIVLSGDLPPVQVYKQLRDLFQERIRIFNVYGQTETIGNCAYSVPKDFDPERGYIYIPVGYPYPHNQAYILDEHLQPVTPGEVGELYIGGACLARGYLNHPKLNGEKFISNPLSQDRKQRLFQTGDLARYWSDGSIELLGRTDFQVKIRGMRVELGEIESILVQHPTVKEAVVIATEDVLREKRLVAYVVPNLSLSEIIQNVFTKELRGFLNQKLADYMVPSAFVLLDSLPLTPNGKIDRLALPVSKVVPPELEVAYVKPQTETEEIIATIWQEVLQVEQVGIHDNFFELGGHSLLATQVISRLRKDFSLELSLQHLFKAPTIASLAQSIEALREVNQDLYVSSEALEEEYDKETLIPQLQEGKAEILTFLAQTYQEPWWGNDNEHPLSPELELYWVASQLTSGDTFAPTFSIPNRSIWECEFDPVLFQRACDLVVERNEILRTRLIRKGAWFLQILSKLLPSSSKNKGSLSKFKRLEQATIALLEKPNSVQARLLHRLISLKIQLEVAVVRQKVLPPQSVSWTYHNYEYVSDEMELQSIVEEITTKESKCPFDMETGPLLRCTVIKHSRNIHTVIAIAHHGFVDFIGIQQVSDELRAVYQALLRNELNSLAVRPQYSDYATRWASLRNSASYRSDIEFWQKHFAQCKPTVVPPQPSTYDREDFSISEPVAKETAALIHSYCQQIRVPASAFFLAGYYLFLYQMTGQSHLYAVVNNGSRPDLESEATIGTFLQLFPLVVNLTQTPTIADVIQASAQNIFAGLDHRKVSLPRLVSHDIRIAAAMMKQPACVFQIIQTTQENKPHRRLPRNGVEATDWKLSIGINGSAQYNINVNYNTAFYGHEYVENLFEEYQQILAIMATNPLGSVLDNLTPFAT
ncbi:amino acid adenylation domain-containing protein [Scytonema sp. PCC 10023]|uniref:amino acid adenylation domain-containing protein n=1 Tax=Scytonema sp. PCC 10023 TaxID=1680591 RepID=UPI0039C75DB1